MSSRFVIPVLIWLAWSLPCPATASEISSTVELAPDGTRVLRQEAVIRAPVAALWQAFTTAEGWMSWAVPFAHVDFAIGGLIETSYEPNARAGDPGNIHNRILSFLPLRMLSIQATRAPPGFPHPELLPQLHTVIEFHALDAHTTRISISGVGYGSESAHDELLAMFRAGNAWSLDRLRDTLEP